MHLLRLPGAAAFATAAFVGRLPISMVSLGIVLLVTADGGSYAVAGALSATYAVASAVIGPLGARWIDRAGQARAVPVLLTGQVICLLGFTAAATVGWPLAAQFVLLVAAGGAAPNVGSLVRTRWAAQLTGSPQLRSAFALEAVIDEVVFVIGPPLVTTVAVWLGETEALVLCAALLVAGTGWLAMQRASQPRARPRQHADAAGALFSRGLVIVVVMMVLLGGVFGGFEVTTVSFTRALGHEGATGLVLALYACGSLLSGVVLGATPLQAGLARQLLWFTALMAAVTLPLPLIGDLRLLLVGAFAAGLSVSPVLITTATIVELLVPAARLTEALTISTSGIAVGFAAGSTISGALVDAFAPNSGYWLMAGCGVAALLLVAGTAGQLRRARD